MNKLFISTIILYSTAALSITAASSIPDVSHRFEHYQSAKKLATQSKKKLSLKKEAITELEKRGIFPVNYIDVLCEAIVNDNIELCKLIVAAGADVNLYISDKPSFDIENDDELSSLFVGLYNLDVTPLHYAAISGNAPIMMLLLQAGADPNIGTYHDVDDHAFHPTPLDLAVAEEHVGCVKILLEAGADPSLIYHMPTGECSLFIAIEKNNLEILKLLINAGVYLHPNHYILDHSAYCLAKNNPECVKLLMKSPAFNFAQEAHILFGYEENKVSAIKYLIETGMKINAPLVKKSLTDIMFSVNAHPELVEHLINMGADINALNSDGETLLIQAVSSNDAKTVEWLIKKGADLNISDKNGNSPLFWALSLKHSECFDILQRYQKLDDEAIKQLQKRIDIIESIRNGESDKLTDFINNEHSIFKTHINYFLYLAAKEGHTEIVKLLLDSKGSDVNKSEALHAAASSGHHEIVKLLIEVKGVDVNKKATAYDDNERKTPLELAVRSQNLECVKLLLNFQGINTDVIDMEDIYWSWLEGRHESEEMIENRKNLVQLLLTDPKTSINVCKQKDVDGCSALHYAAQLPACRQLFLNTSENNINSQNIHGNTPLHCASSTNNNDETLEFLLQLPGIDVNKQNIYGNTPLHVAVNRGNLNAVALLLNTPGINPYIKNKEGVSAIQLIEKVLKKPTNEEINAKLKEIKSYDPLSAYQGDNELVPLYYELKQRPYTDAYLQGIQQRLLHQLPRIIQGESIDSVLESNNTTALHNACALGYYELVQELLQLGASVHAKTEKGATVEQCIGYDPEGKIRSLIQEYK